jgi:hypothetical protein
MFEPDKCWRPQYKTINRFSRSSLTWDNATFFPEKHENFNGCNLWASQEERLSLPTQIFLLLAQELNFKVIYFKNDNSNSGSHRNIDIYNILGHQGTFEYQLHDFSSVLYNDVVTCTVPAGEPYTQLEKMFIIFDKYTWICIGVTLAGSLLVIQIINLMSIAIQKFVFGRDVRTPTLNVASVFLAGGQYRVPGRNFARFLLMSFIWWCLIIRTCYQSTLYKNLQQDLRKPMIKTLDELNDKNFTISTDPRAVRLLGEDFIKR